MLIQKINKLQKNDDISRDTFFENLINRLSYFVLVFLIKTNIFKTPNQITLFSFVIGLISICMINLDYKYLGSSMLTFYIILDFVDGDFARLKNMKSRIGKIIDQFCDRVIFTLIIITNFFLVDLNFHYNFLFILITIIPVIYFFDFLCLKKKINEIKKIKKKNINLNLFKKFYNYFLRPTFPNIICFFILASLMDLNYYFSILIAFSCSLIIFKNFYNLLIKK
jgi:phosphatidylglycerophosphate synthase